jgi:hypothetical protein
VELPPPQEERKGEEDMKKPSEHTTFDLIELVCQLHARALAIRSKDMHDAYVEAREELNRRVRSLEATRAREIAEARNAALRKAALFAWKRCTRIDRGILPAQDFEEVFADYLRRLKSPSPTLTKEG